MLKKHLLKHKGQQINTKLQNKQVGEVEKWFKECKNKQHRNDGILCKTSGKTIKMEFRV